MNFLKTSLLSAISTFIKLASGLVINKVIAVYIGPVGITLIGQFQNFLSMITTLGSGAINSGVTKYVAEYNSINIHKRDSYITAAIKITCTVSTVLGLIIIVSSQWISNIIFHTSEYHILFKLLGGTLWLIALNTVLLSIINGLKEIRLFITVNIVGSILSLIFTVILTVKYSLWGALLAMVITQTLLVFISFPIVVKKLKISFSLRKVVSNEQYRQLIMFSTMAIVSVICASGVQIAIRSHLSTYFSLEEAGYWQSVWMISALYLTVMTTAFSTYYLPKLSELQNPKDIIKEIVSGYKIIVPFVIVSSVIIYVLRDYIIVILFTKEFYPMRELFLFQLIGDFFKICSWSLAILMLAKKMVKVYIITEIVFSALFYLLVVIFTFKIGLEGVVIAYMLNYVIYLVCLIIIIKNFLSKMSKKYASFEYLGQEKKY